MTLRLIRGGIRKTPREIRKRPDARLDREIQSAFARIEAPDGTVPNRAFYDIREGYQWPVRVLGRRLREARAERVPKEQLEPIAKVIEDYIDSLYEDWNPNGGSAA